MAKTFVLNDEAKVNSYGFRILNSGIDLHRFSQNPVMLKDHWNSTYHVIGRWENVRVEGNRLLADPVFDLKDDQAAEIAGKVERDFIKSCSMGISFDPDKMEVDGVNTYRLTSCELMEASIVAVPSNANAVALYAHDTRRLMSQEEISLCLHELSDYEPFLKKTDKNMKKIILSQAALIALGLLDYNTQEGIESSLVEKSVAQMSADLATAKESLAAKETALTAATDALAKLKDAAAAKAKEAAIADVQLAIEEGRIAATAKEKWVSLMLTDPELAKGTLNAIPARKTLGSQILNPAPGAPAEMTAEAFEKLSEQAQLEYKQSNPEAYKKLFA
ncbi:MAG: HK97 family phage prohead protease [Chitinophagaceae bacterium]|nr:HK97 family phage prohead protease [Chitinophagaceae bacterium]